MVLIFHVFNLMRFLLFFALVVPLKSFAALSCSQLFNNYTGTQNSIFSQELIIESLLAADATVARNTIYSINSIIDNGLKLPRTVKLQIKDKEAEAEFNWADTISFPHRFFVNNKPKHPKYTQTILAHEYGHYILSTNLRLDIKNYENFEKQARSAIVYHEKVRQASDAYEASVIKLAEGKKTNSIEKIDILKNQVAEAERYFDEVTDKMDSLIASVKSSPFTRVQVLSYHELFADIIAVVHEGDPRAMLNLLNGASLKNKDEKFSNEARSFLNRIKLNGWNQSEPHILFAPTRRFIWDHILSNPRYYQNRTDMIQRIYSVIMREITDRIEQKSFDLNPEEMNRQLIKKLSDEFP